MLVIVSVRTIFLSRLKFVTGRLTNLEGSAVGIMGPIMCIRPITFIGPVSRICLRERHYIRLDRCFCAADSLILGWIIGAPTLMVQSSDIYM